MAECHVLAINLVLLKAVPLKFRSIRHPNERRKVKSPKCDGAALTVCRCMNTVCSHACTSAPPVICDPETPTVDHTAGILATWPVFRFAGGNPGKQKGTKGVTKSLRE